MKMALIRLSRLGAIEVFYASGKVDGSLNDGYFSGTEYALWGGVFLRFWSVCRYFVVLFVRVRV